MSAAAVAVKTPFVTALRTPRGSAVRVGEGSERLTVRVQFEALWDAIAVDVSTNTTVNELATTALRKFGVTQLFPADYIVKLRGWEVRGAEATVASSGARDGSTFLVAHRFRRAVR